MGYGDTRYYNHARRYRQRAIFEAGLAWRLSRNRHFYTAVDDGCGVEDNDADATAFAFDDPMRQKKHPWRAALEAFGINVGVQFFDRYVMNEDFAKISWSSIKNNIKTGFVWDNDQFSTNLLLILIMADSISMLPVRMACRSGNQCLTRSVEA